MRLPIRYAMTYPQRGENPAEPLDLLKCPPLTFAEPDRDVFSCLRLAEEAATEGGTACAILNGANEAAVALFLEGKIRFTDIFDLVHRVTNDYKNIADPTLDQIAEADVQSRILLKEAARI